MRRYQTPNIDRRFTDWYGQQSCTAGRAAFITGQSPIRTGLTKVGIPGADIGMQPEDPTVGDFMKSLGYATGQFGKNHLGDRTLRLRRLPRPPQRPGARGPLGLLEGWGSAVPLLRPRETAVRQDVGATGH